MPTIFMPSATASAISSMKAACTAPTLTPSACASSWLTVVLSKGDQRSASASSTTAPPLKIQSRSPCPTASTSPNR